MLRREKSIRAAYLLTLEGELMKDRLKNGQVNQDTQDLSPVDGADGFIGAETGTQPGLKVVSGKQGYSTDRPIWNQQSSFTNTQDNTGSTGNALSNGGQDSTDEYASYKKIQTDEGLPQTWRTSDGAGDAGPTDSDEPESHGANPNAARENTQNVSEGGMSDMPQTEFTRVEGGGAPLYKKGS
jgi:hypothetical protein